MKTIKAFQTGDGAHCGLTDWYPEKEAALQAAIDSGKPFDTYWYASKKEIATARIECDGKKIIVQASVSDDFDTIGNGESVIAMPSSLDDIRAAIDRAWNQAEDDLRDNAIYLGYSVIHKKSWVETYLTCIGGSDTPGGDNYHYWGWQDDKDGEGKNCTFKGIPKKTAVAFEQFALSGAVGVFKIGAWSIKSWHDEPVDIEDQNDYRGMGWVGADGRP
jgi:hypothetical protein